MTHQTKLLSLVMAVAVASGGCGDDDNSAAESVGQGTQEAAQDARAAAQDLWASVRTDAERLLDEIRTENAPRFKEELLQRCRDALERVRQAQSGAAAVVEQLCSRIQETDVGSAGVWADIKREIDHLDPVP